MTARRDHPPRRSRRARAGILGNPCVRADRSRRAAPPHDLIRSRQATLQAADRPAL